MGKNRWPSCRNPLMPATRREPSRKTSSSAATSSAATSPKALITQAVDDWLLERLMTFDADAEDQEDNSNGEPDDDAEMNGPPSSHYPS
jgi:hypothetical protein